MVPEQRKLLEMLREIDTICRKHGIEYYLAGGTCIGALRNKGFLPWDDDMDLYMTRENWEKFMAVSKVDFPPDRVLLCPELVESYSNMFGRYCDTSCTSLHKHNMYAKHPADDPCGAIVDILPLYPVPDASREFMQEYAKKLAIYSQLIMPTGSYVHRLFVRPGTYLKYLWRCTFNRQKVLKELYDELFSYDEEACDYYAMRWGGTPLVFPKEWFQTPTETPYEDMVAMMPTMNNAYLTMHYGDSWVMVPNLKEREGHVAISRPDMPYETFRKNYKMVLGRGRRLYMRCFFAILHLCRLIIANKKNRRQMKALSQAGKTILAGMNCQTEEALSRLYEMLEERRLPEIAQQLNPYLSRQLSARYIGREDFFNILRFHNPVYIPVSDEFFHFVLRFCLHSERIHWALRLMDIREQVTPSGEEAKALRADILYFREAVNDYDQKRYDLCYQKVQELARRQGRWLSLVKLQIRLYLYGGVGDREETGALLKTARELFPWDGEFLRYQLLFDRQGGTDLDLVALVEQNGTILSMTRNGMVMLEIKEEMEARFEEFCAIARGHMQAGDFEEALLWIGKGKALYQDDYRERLVQLELETKFSMPAVGEDPEDPDSKAALAKNDRLLRGIKKRLLQSENLRAEWETLYRRLLARVGYGAESVDWLVRLLRCEEYGEIQAMESLFPAEMTEADRRVAFGEWLYALGRTAEAEKHYRYAFFNTPDGSMIHYQMQKRLRIKLVKVM